MNYFENVSIHLSKLEFKCEIKRNKCCNLHKLKKLSPTEPLWNNYMKYVKRKTSNKYEKTETVIYKKEQHTNTQLSLNTVDA